MVGTRQKGIGNRLAPARFLVFGAIFVVATPLFAQWRGWLEGLMLGFDLAAFIFLLSCLPLLKDGTADSMREAARRNDANRAGLLAIGAAVAAVLLGAIATELAGPNRPTPPVVLLLIGTLVLAWTFVNTLYALHYAHLYYLPGPEGDSGGIAVPATDEPDYGDFVYFAFMFGMTFQTSDIEIRSHAVRRVATGHCIAAFVFNVGIVAFSVNVLSGG